MSIVFYKFIYNFKFKSDKALSSKRNLTNNITTVSTMTKKAKKKINKILVVIKLSDFEIDQSIWG